MTCQLIRVTEANQNIIIYINPTDGRSDSSIALID